MSAAFASFLGSRGGMGLSTNPGILNISLLFNQLGERILIGRG